MGREGQKLYAFLIASLKTCPTHVDSANDTVPVC